MITWSANFIFADIIGICHSFKGITDIVSSLHHGQINKDEEEEEEDVEEEEEEEEEEEKEEEEEQKKNC